MKIYTIAEIKQLFSQTFFNATDKVTKISNNSVLSAIISGCSRLYQKVLKELGIVEMYLDIDLAYDTYLDNIATKEGCSGRLSALGSSTYIRLVAEVGTTYLKNTHQFTGSHGLTFVLENDVTITDLGFAYVKVNCTTTGKKTNVEPFSINQLSTSLAGHQYVLNEYYAEGGRDVESDEIFRQRIKNIPNLYNKSLESFAQLFQKTNTNILKVYNLGYNSTGQIVLGIITQNGATLTQNELDNILLNSQDYFSLTELSIYGQDFVNVVLQNMDFHAIDISFRVEIQSNYNIDYWRKECQIRMGKFLDYRFWNKTTLDRGDLLAIAKSVPGVKYVPDVHFFPNTDILIDLKKLPRIRSFILYDIEGNLLSSTENILNDYYFSLKQDINYQQTILESI